MSEEVVLKLIIFGDAGTGKTTLALRYMTGLFKQNKLTLGVQFHVKKVNITIDDDPFNGVKEYSVKLQIWDFGGEMFKSLNITFMIQRIFWRMVIHFQAFQHSGANYIMTSLDCIGNLFMLTSLLG